MLTKAIYAYAVTVAFLVRPAPSAPPSAPFAPPSATLRRLQTASGNCSSPVVISKWQMELGSCTFGAFTLGVALGTPPQPQIYLLDTTSSFLWAALAPNNPGGFAANSSSSVEIGSSEVVVQVGFSLCSSQTDWK